MTEPDERATVDATDAEVELPPANRAERRAKGRKSTPSPQYGPVPGGLRRNPIAASRNFAARRSG